jgi:hypothetical protein
MPRHCRVEVSRHSRGRGPSARALALMGWLMCCIHPANTRAFSDPLAYTDPVDTGGGAGRWFTGSSADGLAVTSATRAKPAWTSW